MYEALFVSPWPWWVAGPAIGLMVTLLAWHLGKPPGVSTGYGVACALGSPLSFFRAKEYGERWRLAFVVGLPLGGLIAAWLAGQLSPTLAFGQLDRLTHGSLAAKGGLLFGGGLLVGAGGIGVWLSRGGGNRTGTGEPVDGRRKAWQSGVFSGGLVLGAGWALTGACPGTSLVQVGEGKLVAVFTVAGILVGTYVCGRLRSVGDRSGLASAPHPA